MTSQNNQKISVYYHFLKDKKINGTLFYCFEYFAFLNKFRDTYYYIHKIDENDLEFIKSIFKLKYDFNYKLLDRIIAINSISEIYKSQGDKNLCLDILSFNSVHPFIQNDFYVFENGNSGGPNFRPSKSKIKNIKYYGSYDYQQYEEYCILKLNFDIFKNFEEPKNNDCFISMGMTKNSKDKNTKKPNTFINIFEKYKKFKYIHNILDADNRFIPECFFYKRDLKFIDECKIIDSAVLRYNDCKNGNLKNYWLDENDKIIQDILNDNK